MRATLIIWTASAALLASAGYGFAQTIGGTSGVGASSGMSGGTSGSAMSIGGANADPTSGASGWPPNPWPPSLGAAANEPATAGSSTTATQQRATEGSSSITSVNADAVARSGNFGAATRIGGDATSSSTQTTQSNTFQSIAGTGPEALYNIPQPRVSVDLTGIRAALKVGPNSTPDRRGY